MISVDEAKNIIDSQSIQWGAISLPIEECMGEVLAEDICADRDFPPFDRVAMDGIAVSFDAYATGCRTFQVQEAQLAGVPAVSLKSDRYAIEIMTGAVLSGNCDLVIRYEDLEFYEQDRTKWVRVLDEGASRWKNIHRQGSDQQKGELLIAKGVVVTAAEVAIMATVGRSMVLANKKPKVAIVSTGDELVEVAEVPLSYQIRMSNSIAIQASLCQVRIPNQRFHLPDSKEQLQAKVETILQEFDIVLLSGGVSKGKADYLPEVLEVLGVRKMFHRVAQKPGKPFWFGMHTTGKPVFAFPGNPISTYLCFRVYFLPFLMQRLGSPMHEKWALLQEEVTFNPDLGYFVQVRSEVRPDGTVAVWPETGNGSGDLANLAKSDAFLYLPAKQSRYLVGEFYPYYSFDISSLA
ncbi:molybdopterin molybdotransferase MoeA [Reichenbachiella carrageenanivorans]|uniref:Molybdopterin molybdenumtransferase n=1 Tax=Reichenbachiella carrageenanivorans TaxID=2979869 RepID=A0ABY6CVQ2_9BACT|nr:molybdopterin molybdotransferase MoeA [Reichenbachiella carrageenanivorans]UXX77987.1 molybdopterin molybdotransferase MoeA [Reichenbachiella carrageenanivorans]